MLQTLKMAFRDLGRNRRRTFFSALAVSVGLGILMLMASVVNGELGTAIDGAIILQSGDIQVRSASYDENKSSLKWADLVQDPDQIAGQIAGLPQVKAATPRLFASGFISSKNQSAGARIYGIDPASVASDPYRLGIISGDYLTADDSGGLLIGKPVADNLHLNAGDSVSLSVNTANGDVEEQSFVVRGIYSTNTYGFDSATILLPFAKAQAITQTQNHASTIFVLLKDISDTEAVAAALQVPSGLKVMTWKDLNPLILDFETQANSYIGILYLIILAITASVIINTLIMSVYERTREIGILSAIGMRGGRIMWLFLAEAAFLALGGVLMGVLLGLLGAYLFNIHGFYIGNMGLSGFMISNTIFAKLTLSQTINLSILTFIITVLAGLYPAIMASRLQPVEALRAEVSAENQKEYKMEIVKIDNATRVYKVGAVETQALRGVSLSIENGEFTALVGPSGSGKTTLLQLIGCLDQPTSGSVWIEGVTRLNRNQRADMRRGHIGFIFQFFALIPTLNAYENVEMPLLLNSHTPRQRRERVMDLLKAVDLVDRAKNRPDQLSGGQQQRIAIARALAPEPALILADEPTANLDTENGRQVMEIMEKLNKETGVTFVFATHDPRVIKYAHRIVTMRDGQIVANNGDGKNI